MLRLGLIVVVSIVSAAAVYLAIGEDAPRNLAAPSPDVVPRQETAPSAPVATEAGRAAVVRNVTPDDVTSLPRPAVAPVRLAQAKPPRPAPREPIATARTERLFNPLVAGAGILRVGDRDIRLAGIEAPDADASCGTGERAWPCGRMARAALRRFIRGRAVECDVPAGADAVPDTAQCSVAGTSLAAWLVAQGWAGRGDGDHAESEARARQAKLGLWGDGRPDSRPTFAATGDQALLRPALVENSTAGVPGGAPDSAPAIDRAISPRVSGMP